ncbi:MAG: class I SAM-dependent methyltransferase [Candidatus Sabulitectum sp.]|nr:class I SAM-dependent methyltransferase [Candidatus Sabulitectum sp.]
MTKPAITAKEHYDRLAEAGHGRDDPPVLQNYMARWDGPLFHDALGDLTGKDVLEVGIGIGRIARQILNRGCRHLTGLDISPKTIAVAQADLAEFPNLELALADITEFRRDLSFDLAYSVLTFMHVEDRPTALENIVASLRSGGGVVLSIDQSSSDGIDFGEWTVAVSRWLPAQYAAALKDLGCDVADPVPLIDSWIAPNGKRSETYGQCVATLIKGVKR